ncbi:MAG TPA: deoxyguanosinetriphosphate triphosphohydrolase, partial [Herpetosiphonaceae bacterium]
LRAGILQESDLPRSCIDVLGVTHSQRINTMVCDLIDNNWWATGEGTPPESRTITMSPAILEATNTLREFMFANVYVTGPAKEDDHKVYFVLGQLFTHFMQHPEALPAELLAICDRHGDNVECAVVDYIAGMTDRYALKVFNQIYVPRTWSM